MIQNQNAFTMEVTHYQPWQVVRMAAETCPAIASNIVEAFYRIAPTFIDNPDQLSEVLGREPETCPDFSGLERKAWRIDPDNRPHKRPDEAVYLVWSNENGLWIEATLTTSGAIMFASLADFLAQVQPSDVAIEEDCIL